MDWTNIVVAGLAFLGSAYGSYKSKDKLVALIEYRLKKLEEKQDKHNGLIEKVYGIEKNCVACAEKIKVANHRIEDLEDKFS